MSPSSLAVTTRSAQETAALGESLGHRLEAGSILALSGDLGSGKTVFVQGLARGLKVPAGYYVTSPTYTLVNEYPGRHRLYHLDLYRLSDPDEFEDLGLDEILADAGVTAIEWAERLSAERLGEHLAVHFRSVNADTREIRLTAYGQRFFNLLKEIEKIHKESP